MKPFIEQFQSVTKTLDVLPSANVSSSTADFSMSFIGNAMQTVSVFVITFLIMKIVIQNWSRIGHDLRWLLCHFSFFVACLGVVKICYICGWLMSSPPLGSFFIIFSGVVGVSLVRHLHWFQKNTIEFRRLMSLIMEEFTKDILPQIEVGMWKWTFETEDAPENLEWDLMEHKIFGTNPDTFQNTYAEFASLVHPEDRERMSREIDEAIQKGTIFSYEMRISDQCGGWKKVYGRGSVFKDLCGNPIYMAGVNFSS